MCAKCDDIDAKIIRYKRVASQINDKMVQEGLGDSWRRCWPKRPPPSRTGQEVRPDKVLSHEMTNSRLAILILIVMAIAIAGIMVETYWDCRLLKGGSLKECMPPHPAPVGVK